MFSRFSMTFALAVFVLATGCKSSKKDQIQPQNPEKREKRSKVPGNKFSDLKTPDDIYGKASLQYDPITQIGDLNFAYRNVDEIEYMPGLKSEDENVHFDFTIDRDGGVFTGNTTSPFFTLVGNCLSRDCNKLSLVLTKKKGKLTGVTKFHFVTYRNLNVKLTHYPNALETHDFLIPFHEMNFRNQNFFQEAMNASKEGQDYEVSLDRNGLTLETLTIEGTKKRSFFWLSTNDVELNPDYELRDIEVRNLQIFISGELNNSEPSKFSLVELSILKNFLPNKLTDLSSFTSSIKGPTSGDEVLKGKASYKTQGNKVDFSIEFLGRESGLSKIELSNRD